MMAPFYRPVKLGALAGALLLPACSNLGRSPFPTPPPPLPVETATPSPTPIAASPSPTSTAPVNAFEKGVDKAASAITLANDAQTPEDWKLVISQWERSIAFLKAVPRTNAKYKAAQKLLPGYQQQLANAQQRAKNNPRQAIAKSTKPSTGGIPLVAGGSGDGADAVEIMSRLNQSQIDYFSKQKRFARTLGELSSSVTATTANYVYQSGGDTQRAISTAISQKPGLPSYTAAVYLVKEGNTSIPVSVVCSSPPNTSAQPGIPRLDGKEVKCDNGSTKV